MAGTRDTSRTPSAGPPADQTPREPVGAEQVRELVGVTGVRGIEGVASDATPAPAQRLSEPERRLLGDLFAIVAEHAADAAVPIDRARVQDAFVFACEQHAAQRRKSGEDFIVHPVGVARICASMQLDTETLCAALLHDTVEDTGASIGQVRERFGDEIAAIVDGVTKLTGISFQSHDEAQAENYRKMMMAMADDPRVISSSSPIGCTTCARSTRCPSRSKWERRARRPETTRPSPLR